MAYTIQRGDTLSQLAQKHGTTVAELIKLNPQIKDPNKIYAGESLALPQATAMPDTTVATSQTGGDMILPPIGDTLPGLPTMDMTNVQGEDVLAMALKNIAQLAQREGKVTGLAATSQFFADRGILPEDLPGSSVANMLAVVDRAMTSPVAERAGSIADLLQATITQKEQARQAASMQLSTMMNNDMWNTLVVQDPATARELWSSAGFIGDPYQIPEAPIFSDIKLGDRITGFTLQESQDIYYNETAPDWWLEKYDEKLADQLKAEFGSDWFNEYKRIMQVPAGSSGGRKNAPLFMQKAQEAWQELRRNPQQSVIEESAIRQMSAYLQNLIQAHPGMTKTQLRYQADLYKEQLSAQGYSLTDGAVNRVVAAVSEATTFPLPDDMLEACVEALLVQHEGNKLIAAEKLREIVRQGAPIQSGDTQYVLSQEQLDKALEMLGQKKKVGLGVGWGIGPFGVGYGPGVVFK